MPDAPIPPARPESARPGRPVEGCEVARRPRPAPCSRIPDRGRNGGVAESVRVAGPEYSYREFKPSIHLALDVCTHLAHLAPDCDSLIHWQLTYRLSPNRLILGRVQSWLVLRASCIPLPIR